MIKGDYTKIYGNVNAIRDGPDYSVELIVRRTVTSKGFQEEKVLRFGPSDKVDRNQIEKKLNEAAQRLIQE